MSIEEFELMSHPFGWKAEYWNGQPDQFYCRLKYSFYWHEVWRHEKLVAIDQNNYLIGKNLEELRQERDRWYEQIEDDWKC